MIIGKSKKELEKMRASGQLIGEVREELKKVVKAGMTTLEINNIADKMIRDGGGYPTFLGQYGFPASIITSVNDEVVHGIPSDRVLKDGDIVSIDMGATLNGFIGDTATTIAIGEIPQEVEKLLEITQECLRRAISQCVVGKHVGDIGWAVQQLAEENGYGVVRDFVGHGIGRKLHEDPQIPNYGKPGTKEKIRAGYVFAVEPMINLGVAETKVLADGWTVVTMDGKPSAHFEHTVAITEEGPEILTFSAEQRKALYESVAQGIVA